jgi:membrane-bound lytic murein transglycosylase A
VRLPFHTLRRWFAAGIAVLALGACDRNPDAATDRLALSPIAYGDLPGWMADGMAEAIPALARSCRQFESLPLNQAVGPGGVAGTVADWQIPCSELTKVPAGDDASARAYFERWFTPWAAASAATSKRQGLFTGYYEIELAGSRTPTGRFKVPVYRRPSDLIAVDLGDFADDLTGKRIAGRVYNTQLKPYADRAAIGAGALASRGLELAWVDDPVGAYFIEIFGFGMVRFPDGKEMRIAYAGHNGHRHVPIGRALVERGIMKRQEITQATLRAWLEAHPEEIPAVMNTNPSFTFFRELEGPGPLGAQAIPLTAGRSLAVDPRYVPYGVPVWVDAADPLAHEQNVRRLLVAQDAGQAIHGPIAGDIFWGRGLQAERRAVNMRYIGTYTILLPKSISPPTS